MAGEARRMRWAETRSVSIGGVYLLWDQRGVVPVALRVGVPLTSQRYDDSRYNRISIGRFDYAVEL